MNSPTDIFIRQLNEFPKQTAGNISIILAFAILPLVLTIGLAIDGSRSLLAKDRLQSAVDAAALAAGTTFRSEEELEEFAFNMVEQNFRLDGVELNSVQINQTSDRVDVTASATVDMYFMGLGGHHSQTIVSTTEIERESGGLMLAMVLDNTGSMWGGAGGGLSRIEALRDSAYLLSDAMFEDTDPAYVRVAMVPYAAMVNPGDEAPSIVSTDPNDFRVTDPQDRTSVPFEDRPPLLYSPGDKTQWKGCVFERPGTDSIADTPPTAGNRWKPLIWPMYNDNQYELESSGTNRGAIIGTTVDPGGDRNSNSFTGPNVGCPTPITPLTNNQSTIEDAIDAMTAWNRGGTLADIGMAWGIRVLSPQAPFTESSTELDSGTNEPIWEAAGWSRAIVLMTDGDNVVFNAGNHGSRVQSGSERSDITGYGRAGEANMDDLFGSSNTGTIRNKVNDRLAQLCEDAKALDIEVYTVIFSSSPSTATRDLYQSCASDPGKYYFAGNAVDLQEAFTNIGNSLRQLRIVM